MASASASASASVAPPAPTLTVSTAVNPEDHGKIVVTVGWLCLIAGVLCTLARIQIRWPLRALSGIDDWVCLAAAVLAIIQSAIVFHEADNGFGKTERNLGPNQRLDIEKVMYGTDLLFLFSLWTGKLSVSFLFHRLATDSNKSKLGWILTGVTSVCGAVSILVVAIRQDASEPWAYNDSGVVSSTLARWAAAGVLSMLVDIGIAALSIYLVWGLQMDPQSKRLVVIGFLLRLFLIPITIVRLVSLAGVNANDFSFSYTLPETLTQLEMHGSIVATTLPCLRLFLRAWNTSFMDMRLQELDPQAYEEHVSSVGRTNANSGGRSYVLSSLKNKSKLSALRSKERDGSGSGSKNGWNGSDSFANSKATVQGGGRDDDALSDNSRRAIVMRQDVRVDVTREDA